MPRLPLGQHVAQHRFIDLERDVEIEVVLRLELERHVRGFEKGQERAIVQAIEGVQCGGLRPLFVSRISSVPESGSPRKSS